MSRWWLVKTLAVVVGVVVAVAAFGKLGWRRDC